MKFEKKNHFRGSVHPIYASCPLRIIPTPVVSCSSHESVMDTPGPGPLHVLVITLTLLTPPVHPCPLTTFPDSWSGADVPGTFYPFGSAEGDTVREGTFEGWGNDNEQLYEDDDLVTIDLSTQVSLPFLGRLESQVTVSTFSFLFFFLFLRLFFYRSSLALNHRSSTEILPDYWGTFCAGVCPMSVLFPFLVAAGFEPTS